MANKNKQWGNLAKFIYDIAKLTFGGIVIGNIISSKPFNLKLFSVGIIITTVQIFLAFYLDGKGEKND
ncbi:MAG: hypothetical protein HZA78_02800 [Candidatus Schekmanbacteria bacterium]|nr:hypothetical protein [Candidatus Schekmanbacteria bacterium]